MATRRKTSRAAKQKTQPSRSRVRIQVSMPPRTLEALQAVSELADMPPDDIIVGLINEMSEQIAQGISKQRAIERKRGPILAALMSLPAFQEAMLHPPRRKAAIGKIGNKTGNGAGKPPVKH